MSSDRGTPDDTSRADTRAQLGKTPAWRLRQGADGCVGRDSFGHGLLGTESSLWVALAVSIMVHIVALLLLVSPREPRHIGAISISLYGGTGGGRPGEPGDGGGAGGEEKRRGAHKEGRRLAPSESVTSEPTVSERDQRESRPVEAEARPRQSEPKPTERGGLVKSARTAPDSAEAAARALAPKGESADAHGPTGETFATARDRADFPTAGSASVAGRGQMGGAGEGTTGGAGGGGGIGGGGTDLQASCIACPVPSYPRRARRRGWEGVVDLRLRLDPAGRVSAVAVTASSGFKVLDDAALAAARRSRFRLRSWDGRTGPVWGRMRYRFEMGEG